MICIITLFALIYEVLSNLSLFYLTRTFHVVT